MEKIKKLSFAKTIDAEKKTVVGYASTYQWDRDQERFVKGAWDLSNYLKNPVVLWSHDISSPPIAKTTSITEDEHGLRIEAQFNPDDARSMQIFGLFEKGFLNAFSVGFIRQDFVMEDLADANGRKGLAITKAELYEYSAVSVPANPGALVSREIADMATKAIGPNVIEKLTTKALGDQFLVVSPKEDDMIVLPPEPQDDLEPALKRIQELAKIARHSPLDETKRSLVSTTISVLNEMLVSGQKEELSPEDKAKLFVCLKEFAEVVAIVHPAMAETLTKTILQVEKAITAPAA